MNLLIFILFINFQTGIEVRFHKNMPENLLNYEKAEILKFFENQYDTKEIEIPENKNLFDWAKENKFDFLVELEFENYEFRKKESYLEAHCEIKIFDIDKRRIYSKNFEKFIYLEKVSDTSFYRFLDFMNHSIYSFLSQVFPPFMKVIEVKDNQIILTNPVFPEIASGTWVKIFNEKGFPVAYLVVQDIIENRIYAKNIYSEKEIKKGQKGVISFAPSNEWGMEISFSSLFIKSDTGGYGNQKNIKPFNNFKYGFNLSFYYKWLSLYALNFNFSFYPVNHLNLWKMALATGKGIKFKNLFVLPGVETGVFLGSQRAKNGINTNSVSFFISPFLKFEIPFYKNFAISLNLSYPLSQSLNSFWYERKGGTEYIADSLLIYKEIKIKGPEARISLNYKFNIFGF